MNVDTLVICGVSTSGCVRATTLDAMQHGFRPMVHITLSHYECLFLLILHIQVVASACGDRTPEIQKANLFDLDSKYADVVSEEEAINNLSKGW